MYSEIRKALVLLSISLVTASFVLAAAPIPFSLKRGVPEIEVIINDSVKASFVIDTGADHVYIDKTFARRHGLMQGRSIPMRPTRGSKGRTQARLFTFEDFKVGDKSFSEFSAVAIDLASQIADTSHGYPDGVLGYSFLKNYTVSLNYVDSTVAFNGAGHLLWTRNCTGGTPRISFELKRHFIVLDTKFNDSIKVKTILDTGASYSLLSPSFAELLELKGTSTVNEISIAGKLSESDIRVLVRDISTFTSAAKDDDIVGILGTSFLLGRRYDIDYSNKLIWVYLQSEAEVVELLFGN